MSTKPLQIVGADAGGQPPPASVASPQPNGPARVLVWDVAVRLFHWSLVGCVLAAWATGGSGHRLHEICGFVVAALLLFRLMWGFAGTPHARFSDFVRSPAAVGRYLFAVLRNRAPHHVGHNPVGGYMILAMLLALIVVTVTGIMQLSNEFFGVAWVERVHHLAADGVMLMVPIHLAGVLVSSWMHQENLVGAMVRGTKPLPAVADGASAVQPGGPEQMLIRVQASQGLTVLMFLIGGGILAGWAMTANRTSTEVAEVPATPQVAEVSKAVQSTAGLQARDQQDYVTGGPDEASQSWLVSSGGRLYDNWYRAMGKAGPATTHPAWPAANTSQSGEATWRCKSCHGWDYQGRDGQYASGANATGIVGVQRMRGRDPEAIVAILGNATHRYTEDMLPRHARYRIALFIAKGQHTASQYVLASGRIRGEAQQGKPIFQSVCASCHGFDGRARKLGVASDATSSAGGSALYVGTKANSNPVEVLHKIRNGHPGAIMVSMRPFGIEVAANLLAYVQTLPVK